MPIPESQLKTWANPGATATAKTTHEAIRAALAEHLWPEDVKYEVYLQGSYRNVTNIRGDSDVDVVVQLNSAFRYDISQLSPEEQAAFARSYSVKARYWFPDFRKDVLGILEAKFPDAGVESGSKSIRVPGGPGRLKCDVIPCVQYRRYKRHISRSDEDYVEGMTFLRQTLLDIGDNWIVNYPKKHYENGAAKNAQEKTSGLYKSAIRIFKNARTYLVERDALERDTAPSYFLECLLYNAPNNLFQESLQTTVRNTLNWLSETEFEKFVCQNEQFYLFGDASIQWSTRRARRTRDALITLWNDWYE